MQKPKIYLGTIALEKNRWSSRVPSYLVSEWLPKIKAAGFDGLELWENHVLSSPGGAEALKNSGFPIAIYNHYGTFSNSPEDIEKREKAVKMINFLGAGAVKFNVGNDPALLGEYRDNVLRMADAIDGIMFCECHANTLLEFNDDIVAFFKDLCPEKFQLMVHPFIEPNLLDEKFEIFGSRLTHIHSQLSSDSGERICLDRWPQRVNACFDVMKKQGFTGNFTVEFTELTAAPGENIDDLFANTIRDLTFIRSAFS